jgi:hypothetical protein
LLFWSLFSSDFGFSLTSLYKIHHIIIVIITAQ